MNQRNTKGGREKRGTQVNSRRTITVTVAIGSNTCSVCSASASPTHTSTTQTCSYCVCIYYTLFFRIPSDYCMLHYERSTRLTDHLSPRSPPSWLVKFLLHCTVPATQPTDIRGRYWRLTEGKRPVVQNDPSSSYVS